MPSATKPKDQAQPTSAAVEAGLEPPQATVFDYFSETWYDGSGGQDETENPRSSEQVNEKESREFLRFAAEQADADATCKAAEHVKADLPDVFEMFREKTKPLAPQWADRTTGREVSPAEWIRMHYGKRCEDGSWNPDGLTRADINQSDRKLYVAYAQWIKRHPEDDLGLVTVQRAKVADPEVALERQRASRRRAYYKANQPG